MFIKRELEAKIVNLSKKFPVLVLTGGRQTGKTTLVKYLFKSYKYINLEDIELREYAQQDPKGFLQQYNKYVIIDEVQYAPQLFSYIQVLVDEEFIAGRFVLTGSQNFSLIENISQSLVGRAAIVELMPFTFSELSNSQNIGNLYEEYLIKGFYPPIYSRNLEADQWFPSFVTTYLERDVRLIQNVENLLQFKQFLYVLSSSIGQTINFSAIGNTVGISHNTARRWLSILEASYIIFLLPPYFRNLRKRVTKMPKLYFYDVGLATYLLGIKTKEQLENHVMRGQLFENFIVSEVYKRAKYSENVQKLFFYRDKNANEIDLIIDDIDFVYAIEIKAAKTFNTSMIQTIKKAESLTAATNVNKLLVYGGDISQQRDNIKVVQWRDFLSDFLLKIF